MLHQTKGTELYTHTIGVDLVATTDKYMEFGVRPKTVTRMALASGQKNSTH